MNSQETIKITPYSFRNFMRRLNNAAIRRRVRESQLEMIGGRMRELSGAYQESAYPAGAHPQEDTRVRNIAEAERTIAMRQRAEQREIDFLREKVKLLEENLESLSHIHSFVAESHSQRIAELQNAMAKARKEQKNPEMAKEDIHKFVLEKVKPKEEEKNAKKEKLKTIKSLQKSISGAEKMYAKLKRKGHPKEDLKRLKDVIEGYKRRLNEMKKK